MTPCFELCCRSLSRPRTPPRPCSHAHSPEAGTSRRTVNLNLAVAEPCISIATCQRETANNSFRSDRPARELGPVPFCRACRALSQQTKQRNWAVLVTLLSSVVTLTWELALVSRASQPPNNHCHHAQATSYSAGAASDDEGGNFAFAS